MGERNVDFGKAYARWTGRRLLLLLPAIAATALLGLYLGLEEDLRPSARVALLAVAAVLESLFVAVAGLILVCHRLHRSARRSEAHLLRRLLEPAERLVAPAVLLLLPIALAPIAFRCNEPTSLVRNTPAPPLPRARAPLPEDILVSPVPVYVPAPAPAAPVPVPDPVPVVAPLPPAAVQVFGGEGDDNDVFRLLREDRLPLDARFEFARLGVPEDGRPLDGRPVAVKLDALMLWEDQGMTGTGLSLQVDIPFDGGPILRLSTLTLGDAGEADFADWTEFALTHTTLDAVFRVLGGTRHAALDLWVSAGLAVDTASGDGLNAGARLSPHVALDLAFWQTERVGFEIHVGQTIPVAVGGGAAAITEASLALRIDLSERVSLRAGWRHLLVHLRDYDEPFETEGLLADVDRELSGPFVGLELRF
jgi:hypothetical protein